MAPKILLLDIETAPAVAYLWGLFDKYVPIDRIVEPGYTLCWAGKWLGTQKIHFSSVRKHGMEGMLDRIHGMLEDADMVVHYNGSRFDVPTLNREFVIHDYAVPATFKEVDLYRTVKQRFRFMSNKLDFVAQQLGCAVKVKHKGMDLWKECMAGKGEAWKEMEAYNRQDVVVLEEVYRKLLPWIQPHPNFALYVNDDDPMCPHCGGKHLQRRGWQYTDTMRYPRWQCMDLKNCGKWSRSRATDLPIEKRRNLLVGVK